MLANNNKEKVHNVINQEGNNILCITYIAPLAKNRNDFNFHSSIFFPK